MSQNNIQCPSCGGPNDNSDNKDNISCLYCDQEIITQEVKDGTSAIKPKNEKLYNFLQLADSSLEGGEDEEALNYYNKVLEEDTSYSAAWFGKGSALINTSKIGDIKMSGTITSFKNAVKYSKNKDDMKKVDFAKTITENDIRKENFIYSFLSSIRQKMESKKK